MLAYLAIFACTLAGYGGAPPWVIAATAIALAAISYSEHAPQYERGRALGLLDGVNAVLLRSLLNGVAAAAVAFGGGCALKWL